MSLTKDEIAVIEKAADLLDGWLKNLIRDNFEEMGCFIPLHAWHETHIVKAVDILIQKMPILGESVKRECDDLLKKAQSLSSIGERHSPEFQHKQADLSLLARRIIPRFRGLESNYRFRLTQEKRKIYEQLPKAEGSKIMITAKTSKENWEAIRSEYDVSKKDFGKKFNFVSDSFKRKIIFRDVEHAFVLASQGFSKPALILAGGVVEELLRLYLEHKNIKQKNKRFVDYITACEDNSLLKRGVSRLSDSVRNFRNLVHLENEKTRRDTVSKATAKGAVSSIFTIANDFQ